MAPYKTLQLRLPRALGERLQELAAEEGLSLNQMGIAIIAGALRWQPQGKELDNDR